MRQSKMEVIQRKFGKPIEEILIQKFEKHGTQIAVADELGISQSTLNIWLLKLGLEQKTILVKKGSAA